MTKQQLTDDHILKLLDWAYEKSLNGIPGMDSVFEVADHFLHKYPSANEEIDELIRSQIALNAVNGFALGIGGLATLPIVIPVNVSVVTLLQIRMIGAIAYIRGYDLEEKQTRAFVYIFLSGDSTGKVIKKASQKIGVGIAKHSVKSVNSQIIKAIYKAVGFRLITKIGGTGFVNIAKAVPVLGGFIGATIDGVSTKTIGEAAKQTFK